MTAIMSFSNAPDGDALSRVAGALAVDEAFIEKDWFVVQAIRLLVALETPDIKPVFSGGTALLKAHGLIKRFSEDIDFKLALSDTFLAKSPGQRKSALSGFKKDVAAAWEEAGFTDLKIEAGSGNTFIKIEMNYPTVLDGHAALRPHIQAELSAKPPRLPPHDRPLTSFVAQFRGEPPEVASIPCVDPVETGADKLSAFTWRALVRERGGDKDDPTIIRHVHDLAVLEPTIATNSHFGILLAETLIADTQRGGGAVADLAPKERLAAMLARLRADDLYAEDYRLFVEDMAFESAEDIPSFEVAVRAVERLSALLPA
ncbi:nucleotidyl transferase AbiEii/AbiGii toxin family protein [Sphingosinicella ginsenosidimutans]|uniref:Nucleotidyl transferase AbiEii/AbiGii toxin family protein n=2 Tax=Allosphingosinicella ginsenosidimutans TaxID=1176539 RepID=A0A5C6TY78_9SPHN|nr:nucleotidyl transferase AbiEii/AbiGii toxin family protein [Sphingosinicella ginsenosidimutans]